MRTCGELHACGGRILAGADLAIWLLHPPCGPQLLSNRGCDQATKMAGSSGMFRSYVWDPLLIVSQIIAVQFMFYVCLGAWIFSIDKLSGRYVAISQVFDGKVPSLHRVYRVPALNFSHYIESDLIYLEASYHLSDVKLSIL